MKVIVLNHMSLDGVIQSPGRSDEDTRGGFAHGGWAARYGDEVMMRWIGPVGSGGPGGLLMGRVSYEGMLGHWNRAGGPFKDALNAAHKYVASRNPATTLAWPNSTLLQGDVPAAITALKREQEGPLLIMGSGALIHSLLPHDLIDEYRLAIYPLLLGGGLRMFPNGGMSRGLELVESITSTTGVLLTTYRPVRDVAPPS